MPPNYASIYKFVAIKTLEYTKTIYIYILDFKMLYFIF